ncbi:CD63 antigen [Syngnathoides biaculeatus]|uniref:CD63 antigen n=1 Tax=Syngnathoides biaculeatus TaxID=300417 RepID=UPI002ADE8C40|nr:CD63 antigen [Syngnathoides biaculeatus]
MSLEGGMRCVKYLLFFFNFIFWLCGLALIVVGVLVQVGLHRTVMIQDASASGAPIVIIAIGVVIFFISFFGCCGAWKENYCMVTMFSILLTLVILVQIAAAITGYVFRNKVADVVQNSLADMISRYSNSSAEFKGSVDALQKDLKCCGINGSADWLNFRPDGNSVPDSCCSNVSTNCGVGAMTDPGKVHQKGCRDALEEFLKKNILWVIIAALVLAFIEIMGIVFACVLMRGIRSGYEVM